jgi:transposase
VIVRVPEFWLERKGPSGITKQDAGRLHNRRLSRTCGLRLRFLVGYKARLSGIAVEDQEESHTSQTCPLCLERRKTHDRNYRCPQGPHLHRDLVEALNIRAPRGDAPHSRIGSPADSSRVKPLGALGLCLRLRSHP